MFWNDLDEEDALQQFVLAADHFCEWLESDVALHADDALRFLGNLYNSALFLPAGEVVSLGDFDRMPVLEQIQLEPVRLRLAYFPFLYYWDIEHALPMDGEEPRLGEINDDLADIYKDVKEGLLAFQSGLKPLAVWHWRQTWAMHWGKHAVSALKALHENVTS